MQTFQTYNQFMETRVSTFLMENPGTTVSRVEFLREMELQVREEYADALWKLIDQANHENKPVISYRNFASVLNLPKKDDGKPTNAAIMMYGLFKRRPRAFADRCVSKATLFAKLNNL